ncbi:hypothetical protein FRC00_014422 [Tulasnella sp. 408]|nr:hypothetical protein FRC00_014422 [Tulasnella sp. 408]
MQNDYTKAPSFFIEALTSSTDTRDDEVTPLALQSLAELHFHQKEYRDAASCYSQILEILSDKAGIGKAQLSFADGLRLLKEYSKTAVIYSKVLEMYSDTATMKERAEALVGLAEVHKAQGKREERANALFDLAELHRLQTNYQEAVPLYSEASTIYMDTANSKDCRHIFGSRRGSSSSMLMSKPWDKRPLLCPLVFGLT